MTTGRSNAFMGHNAGYSTTEGDHNVLLGDHAGNQNTTGSFNVIIGGWAGAANVTGFGNVFLGLHAGRNETESNKLYIANGSFTNYSSNAPRNPNEALIYGEFDTEFVQVNDVLRLRPRSSEPSNATAGMMYMDSNTNKLLVFDGTDWQASW